MRRRSISHLFDNIFWYFVYLFPLICFIISMTLFKSDSYVAQWFEFNQYMPDSASFGESFYAMMELFTHSDSIITSCLFSVFGEIVPIFENAGSWGSGLFLYASYFVGCVILHLCVDFLLFIPRLAHKWMNGFTYDDGV